MDSGSFSIEPSISYKLLLINVGTQFCCLQSFALPEDVHAWHRMQRDRYAERSHTSASAVTRGGHISRSTSDSHLPLK